MAISQQELRQLLERLIFDDTTPQEWVQDVWDLNPMLGDSAAKLLEAFEAVLDRCPDTELQDLLQYYYEQQEQ